MQVSYSWHRVWWTPQPLGLDAGADVFSEGRALRTTSVLADDIGDRAVCGHTLAWSLFSAVARMNSITIKGNVC